MVLGAPDHLDKHILSQLIRSAAQFDHRGAGILHDRREIVSQQLGIAGCIGR